MINKEPIVQMTFISDPGHGWLRINLEDFLKLNVATEVSIYSFITPSYNTNRYVYLEEDCDACIAINELKRRGISYEITDMYVDEFDVIIEEKNLNGFSLSRI
jgi:hypothetical protein